MSTTFHQMFNRMRGFWPTGYQRASLEKSHQNGYYIKQAMQKVILQQDSYRCQWIIGPLL